MAKPKIGFHAGVGGNRTGIGEYVDQCGKYAVVKSVNDGGLAAEAADGGALAVYRDEAHDLPNFNAAPKDAAVAHWGTVRANLPPEVIARKDRIWIETCNEPGLTGNDATADWLGTYAYWFAFHANLDGYRVIPFACNAGEPALEQWLLPGMVTFLKYAEGNTDRVAMGLHEGKTDPNASMYDPVASFYPHLIGRYRWLHGACDTLGIGYPSIVISELAWAYNDMPDETTAMRDVADMAEIYAEHGNVLGACLWTLHGGSQWAGLPDKLQKLIAPVTQYTMTTDFPDPDPPDPPKLNYKSITVLLPQDATLAQIYAVRAVEYEHRRTITQSHDEALRLRELGLEGSYTIVYDIEKWPVDIQVQLTDGPHELRHFIPPTFDPVWPLNDTVHVLNCTSGCDWRDPRTYNGKAYEHEGVDLRSVTSTGAWADVVAVQQGIVQEVGYSASGYGHFIALYHDTKAGDFYSWYGHLSETLVENGDIVRAGDVIGVAGNSGASTGPHLHFGIEWVGHPAPGNFIIGDWVDPRPYLGLPVEPPPPPPGPTYDLLDYLRGDGHAYMVQHPGAGQEKLRTVVNGPFFKQLKNSQWEQFWYDPVYLWRGIDISPGSGLYYRQFEPGQNGARWCKRLMRVGETWTGPGHTVQFYDKATCQAVDHPSNGQAVNRVTLVAHHATKTWNGVTVGPVVELRNNFGETFYFAKGYGLVAWSSPWGTSAISDDHVAGDNAPEEGCFS